MSSKARKSWHEKLEHPPEGLPKVVDVPPNWEKRMGGRKILVPTPLMADEAIRKIPKGKLITTGQIRQILAKSFKPVSSQAERADSTCPLTLGIFLRIISEAAEEDRQAGKSQITPYWRVVKDDGSLNPKYPGGVEAHAAHLKEEGHKIIPGKGKKLPKSHGVREGAGLVIDYLLLIIDYFVSKPSPIRPKTCGLTMPPK